MTTVSALISLQDALGAVMPGDQAVEMQIAKQVKGDLLDGGAEDELVTELTARRSSPRTRY